MSGIPDRIAADLYLLPGTASFPGDAAGRPLEQVLLTGATGFVGVYLLRELLARTDADIHCLMRAPDRAAGLARLAAASARYGLDLAPLAHRVRILPGDLTAPRCGLAAADWDGLADNLEAIVHNGAQLNFVRPYESMRAANVDATRWLLLLAAEAACGVSQVSTVMTITVRGGVDRQGRERLLETDPPPAFDELDAGYGQSKWAAERLVEMASAAGVPSRILRVGPVIGDARAGHAPDEQVQQRLTAASVAAGVLPAPRGPIDMVPVEFIAQATVALTVAEKEGVFHLVNPEPLTGAGLRDSIRRLGLRLDIVPFEAWLTRMRAAAAADPAHPLGALLANDELASGIRELGYRLPVFDCSRTTAALTGTGIVCPPPDDTLVARLLQVTP